MAQLVKPQEAEAMIRSAKIVKKIRERYSLDDELAIQRKYLLVANKPSDARNDQDWKAIDEFRQYYTYVEECKNIVDEALPF